MHPNHLIKRLVYSILLVFSLMVVAGCVQHNLEPVDQSSSTTA